MGIRFLYTTKCCPQIIVKLELFNMTLI